MAHTQKPDLVFQWNERVHLNRRGCQFSQLLAVEECGSEDSNCIDHVPMYSAKLLAIHSIRIFPLHFPSCASPCAIRFRTRYTFYQSIASCVIWISETHISAYTESKICTKFPTLLGIIFTVHNKKNLASNSLSSATPDCWRNHGKNFVVETKCQYKYTNTYFVSNCRLWQVKHCYVSPSQVANDTHTHYNCDICFVCYTELLQCFCCIGTSHKFLKPK